MSKFLKALIITFSILIFFLVAVVALYVEVLPKVISNKDFIKCIEKTFYEASKAELSIKNPTLKTGFNTDISFKIDDIAISKNSKQILDIKNFNTDISLKNVLFKEININKLGADDIFLDINEILNLAQNGSNSSKPLDYKIRLFHSNLYLKKCRILYRPKDGVLIKVIAKDIEITKQRNPEYVHFSILTDLEYDNQKLRLLFKDFNRIYFKNNKINIDNFQFIVDRCMVNVNGYLDRNNHYDIDISAKNFKATNIRHFLDSNIIIPNGKDILACFKDLNGTFDFNFNFNNKGLNGNIDLNKINVKLIPIANLPFTITKGEIVVGKKDINIKNINAYYGNKINNRVDIKGIVKNYTKTADTTLDITGIAENQFAKYVSKVAGLKLELKNLSKFALRITFDIKGKIKVIGSAKVPKGSDLLVENSPISSDKFDRALGIKLIIDGIEMNIEHINYYISDFISDNNKPTVKPLVSIKSKLNIITGNIKELEFDIPELLPSEFFNVLINQKFLKRGTFKGYMKYDNHNQKNPHIDTDMILENTSVVGTGLYIKKAKLISDRNNISVESNGIIRKAKYTLKGNMQNKILFPFVIKDVNITIDELDIDRVMQSFAQKPKLTDKQKAARKARMEQLKIARSDVPTKYFEVEEKSKNENTEVEPFNFVPNIIVIKNCNFNLNKGQYKLINFGNLHAKLTLTKDGILEIKSNKFDFADGISTLKVYCDMVKQNYAVRLGAKDVDSDAIASTTMNLPKEISGKASALLEFYTDKNMKLNGKIQFAINNGSITKLGLVQYILNVASIFRNPIVMISPTTILDIVNIPDGTFKKINGTITIKNNIADRIMIKSSSPQLSSFIAGSINLENMDTSLRIYTKFSNKNKGFVGFLRSMSLDAISQKVPFTTKEDASYYAAELNILPKLDIGEDISQVFLTKVDGDIQTNNFISSLRKIK